MINEKDEEMLSGLTFDQIFTLLKQISTHDDLSDKTKSDLSSITAEFNKQQKRERDNLREIAPSLIDQLNNLSNNMDLSIEVQQQIHAAVVQLTGFLFSFWLPRGIARKVFMFSLLIIGMFGSFLWHPLFAIFFLFGCSFSPRLVGETANLIGLVFKKSRSTTRN